MLAEELTREGSLIPPWRFPGGSSARPLNSSFQVPGSGRHDPQVCPFSAQPARVTSRRAELQIDHPHVIVLSTAAQLEGRARLTIGAAAQTSPVCAQP